MIMPLRFVIRAFSLKKEKKKLTCFKKKKQGFCVTKYFNVYW